MHSTLAHLLSFARKQGASDLHLSTNKPVMLRIDGKLLALDTQVLNHEQITTMLDSVMKKSDFDTWQHLYDCDFAITTPDGRFRVNAFYTNLGAAAVFRVISTQPAQLHQLTTDTQTLQSLNQITTLKSGLVLVTGATGSGKSTTLSAIINQLNEQQKLHILTIEDPIEFEHKSKLSLINQRQIGSSTPSFEQALRSALREDPDVILVGELRDLPTIRLALTAAETGHLVLSTLHTVSAIKSIDRIVDVFDGSEKQLVRTLLADSLQAVIAQRLLPAIGGGRVAAFEILTHTPAVANLIRENKLPQLHSVLQTGSAAGMISQDASIKKLLAQGKISQQTANEYLQISTKI